jgi:hypothetical protein
MAKAVSNLTTNCLQPVLVAISQPLPILALRLTHHMPVKTIVGLFTAGMLAKSTIFLGETIHCLFLPL